MTAVTGGIEGVGVLLPPDRCLADHLAGDVAQTGKSGVEPFFLANVKSYRQSLQSTFVHRSEEVINILAAKGLGYGVAFLSGRPDLHHLTGIQVGAVALLTYPDRMCRTNKLFPCKPGSVRLHGKTVH